MFFKFRNVTNTIQLLALYCFYLLGNWSSSIKASVFFSLGKISSLITFCDMFVLCRTYQVDIDSLCLLIFLSHSQSLCLLLCVLEDVLDYFSHCCIRFQFLFSPSDFFLNLEIIFFPVFQNYFLFSNCCPYPFKKMVYIIHLDFFEDANQN